MNAFHVCGGILVLWAVFVSVLGIVREDFPRSDARLEVDGRIDHIGHFGFSMVNQWRYAFKRHSVIHSGSFFLAERARTTSSFRPGGKVSASMSVTKPYLYSWATRS